MSFLCWFGFGLLYPNISKSTNNFENKLHTQVDLIEVP